MLFVEFTHFDSIAPLTFNNQTYVGNKYFITLILKDV
jgi:hypothetical protein